MENTERNGGSRWLIAAMGTVLQLCLGTVYAWSYFQGILTAEYAWNNTQVSLIFSFAIFFLGVSAAVGGVWLPRVGPRRMAVAGSVLFSLGYAVAGLALSLKSLPLLYLGYGVVGGTGLGLGYVTPVATVSKWFPDKKGLATGMVIMGFGLGALFMSKILAPVLIAWTGRDLPLVFLCVGGVFFVLTFTAALFLRNPPAQTAAKASPAAAAPAFTARQAVLSGRFALLWLMFFCNITAGIAIVSFQSPLFQDLWRRVDPALSGEALTALGATLIAVSSLFNGFGRFLWGAVSDRLGRAMSFRIMLGSEVLAFAGLLFASNPWVFAGLVCWVLLCYGGGFGTMPSTISETFGAGLMAGVYGAVLTAWSAGGIAGPQIVAFLKDAVPQRASFFAFLAGLGFLAVGFAASLFLSNAPFAPRVGQKPARAAD